MFGKLNFIKLLILSLVATSCTESYQERTATVDGVEVIEDAGSSKLIAELPVKIDSSKFLVFPVKELLNDTNGHGSYKIRKGYHNVYRNLIFQDTEDQKTHFLSPKELKILNFDQLTNYKNEPEKVILYRIIDKNYKNKELEKISLYLSDEQGKKFTKISPENHHLKDWKYLPPQRKIYFNTSADINADGKLDDKDDYFPFSVSIDDFKTTQLLENELQTLNNKL